MKKSHFVLVSSLLLVGIPFGTAHSQGSSPAPAPVAGQSTLGVSVAEMATVIDGWSAKKDILDKDVYNDQNQKVGKIEDIIIAPDKAVSFAIIGAGGFLGMGRHDVAIPIQQIKLENKKFVLPNATKEALKELPKFEYAPKK